MNKSGNNFRQQARILSGQRGVVTQNIVKRQRKRVISYQAPDTWESLRLIADRAKQFVSDTISDAQEEKKEEEKKPKKSSSSTSIFANLPIIGLAVSMTSKYGVYGRQKQELYQLKREIVDADVYDFWRSQDDLELEYGKVASFNYCLLVLWFSRSLLGVFSPSVLMKKVRQARHYIYYDAEVTELRIIRDKMIGKGNVFSEDEIPDNTRAEFAVDGFTQLILGTKLTDPVADRDAQRIADLIYPNLDNMDKETILKLIETRPQRATAYQ